MTELQLLYSVTSDVDVRSDCLLAARGDAEALQRLERVLQRGRPSMVFSSVEAVDWELVWLTTT